MDNPGNRPTAKKVSRQHFEQDLALARELYAQGRLEDAAVAYEKLLTYRPDFAGALIDAGTIKLTLGRLDEAYHYLAQALAQEPTDPVLLTSLGVIERERSHFPQAADYFRQAVEHQPDHAEAHYNLAVLLIIQGKLQGGETRLRHAITLKPDFSPAYLALGQLLGNQGNVDEASSLLERARGMQPDSGDISASLAELRIKAGNIGMAMDILEPLLRAPVVSPGVALCFSRVATTLNRETEALDILIKKLGEDGLYPLLRARIHFAIGDLYDAAGQFGKAFEYFRLGNGSEPDQGGVQTCLAQIQILRQAYKKENPSRRNNSSNRSSVPVFIVGMPRSGTTLVEQILASHPDISGGGELTYLGDLLNSFRRILGPSKSYPFCADSLTVEELDTLAHVYLEKLLGHSSTASRITDKMPHNFLHLGIIAQLFPASRVIHCQRNPLDTCLSIYTHHFSANHPYATGLENLGAYYKAYTELMEHWKNTLDLPILDVVYEELVTNQEQVTREMIDFCGLDWNETCLRFYEANRIINTPSQQQVRRPLYTKSIGRWRHYEESLQALMRALE